MEQDDSGPAGWRALLGPSAVLQGGLLSELFVLCSLQGDGRLQLVRAAEPVSGHPHLLLSLLLPFLQCSVYQPPSGKALAPPLHEHLLQAQPLLLLLLMPLVPSGLDQQVGG